MSSSESLTAPKGDLRHARERAAPRAHQHLEACGRRRNRFPVGPSPAASVRAYTGSELAPPPSVLLSHSPVANPPGSRRDKRIHMVEPNAPGPGRSTSETAVNELKKEIARRNEETQKAARKKRAAREKEHLANLRQWDRL